MEKLVDFFQNSFSIEKVSAHCDIPCKIYDPINAQISVLTMIRMVDLLLDLEEKTNLDANDKAQFSRLIDQKEEHGHRVKEEVRVIWGDYFKEPQILKFPELHELSHSIMLLSSKAKQNIDKDVTLELLEKVNKFAEIFWKTKNVDTYKAVCPYPPQQEVIYPDLKR